MEPYAHLLEKTSYQQPHLLITQGDFITRKSVSSKAYADGQFKPFFGDTTVFDIDDDTKAKVATIQDTLYEEVPECFCCRLAPHTTHMTLHDLDASERMEEVAPATFNNEVGLLHLIKEQPISPQTIHMKTHFVVDSVATSLVLALHPLNEEEWNKLQVLYDAIDSIRPLNRDLYPHITLAYYHPNGFPKATADRLREVVFELNKTAFSVILDTRKLFYQKFTDMNSYYSVFPLSV